MVKFGLLLLLGLIAELGLALYANIMLQRAYKARSKVAELFRISAAKAASLFFPSSFNTPNPR